MKRIFSALALLTLSVVGCGDDDDDSGENTGATAGTAGTNASAGGEQGSSDGGSGNMPPQNVMCDPELDGVCQNPTDCPFVESGQARMTAGICGRDCLLAGNTEASCPGECVLMELEMTADCADCYAGAAVCGIMNCTSECIDDPEAEMCQTCLVDNDCRSEFSACSGLEQ